MRLHTPESLTPTQRRIVDEAVRACSDVLTDGWNEAVAEQATNYVATETWEKLFRSRRHRHCRVLADIAKMILDGKTKLHDLIGSIAAWLASLFGGGHLEQRFARELASRIPLPVDAKLVATARGVQITGILLCVVNDDHLGQCQCFIDLALDQAKTNVKRVLVTAMSDWAGLAQFPNKTPLSTSQA